MYLFFCSNFLLNKLFSGLNAENLILAKSDRECIKLSVLKLRSVLNIFVFILSLNFFYIHIIKGMSYIGFVAEFSS